MAVLAAVLAVYANAAAPEPSTQLTAESAEKLFLEKIRPVIASQCLPCHGPALQTSGLDLRTRESMLRGGQRGPAVVPGRAAQSRLFLAIAGKGELKMPPGKDGPLPDEIVAAFRQWIDAGAPWPERRATDAPSPEMKRPWSYTAADLWAFQPRKRYPVPAEGLDPASVQTPVDAFLLQKLREKKLKPAPPADRLALIRRATFDLTGLPPTPEEVDAFRSDPLPTAKAFAKVVERLLASPRYGERWGRHWLDVVRYADTGGGSNDYERPNAWRYRDYVIRSFNQDKPYDRFIREQLAGDELDDKDPEHLIATGFLRMGPWEHTSMSVEAVTRQEWLDDVTHSTAAVFLALTMNCAKCHDHKFDPIPTKDYYRLQAVFANTFFEERPAPFLPVENRRAFASESAPLQQKLARTQAKLDEVLRALGKKPTPAGERAAGAPPTASERKPVGGTAADAENRELERAYRKRVEIFKKAQQRYEPLAYSVASGGLNPKKPPEDTSVLMGGSLSAPGEKVTPGAPAVALMFSPDAPPIIPATVFGRRRALAEWIASPSNPLTARVMVNRIWQYHFGRGLVETSNNFGKMGQRPSHPELLDWLAEYFIERGWSVKAMHRLIMSSAAYQRSAQPPEPDRVAQADPENRWLSYMSPRRMEAEALRDSLLAVSGELDLEAGGPGTFPEINADLAAQPRLIMGTVAPAYEPSPTRAQRNRRTIYTVQPRSLINPLVEVFNGANPNESCERRRVTTVAPQVFNLFNSQFSYDMALAFARRLEKISRARAEQVEWAFRLAFQRAPTETERRSAEQHLRVMTEHHRKTTPPPPPPRKPIMQAINSEFTGQTIYLEEARDDRPYERNLHPSEVPAETRALAELCLVLFNANEFVYIY